jgi:hypothetical protein
VAAALDRLAADAALARRLGEAGRRTVAGIDWDVVVARLTETLPGTGGSHPAVAEPPAAAPGEPAAGVAAGTEPAAAAHRADPAAGDA